MTNRVVRIVGSLADTPSIVLPKKGVQGKKKIAQLGVFAEGLIKVINKVGRKLSGRGWCYILEGMNIISKDQFDAVQKAINNCRIEGILPIDFVTQDERRVFYGVERPTTDTPEEKLIRYLQDVIEAEIYYTPDWWEGEKYYIQMLVEKGDLVNLFSPVTDEYHIPVAATRGWSSDLQIALTARRFGEAQERGLKGVLLCCFDMDPSGVDIFKKILVHLDKLKGVKWLDGTSGYDPKDLILDRFGLNLDFIDANNLMWIDNLITARKKDLTNPNHPHYNFPYMAKYRKMLESRYGKGNWKRKCEANALVVIPQKSEDLCRSAIEKYLGSEALARFQAKTDAVKREFDKIRSDHNLDTVINNALSKLQPTENEDEE